MPAVDVLRRKREMGYAAPGDGETADAGRKLPIDPDEIQSFAAMGYKPGESVNLAVTGTWDGDSVSVESVQCMPPQQAAPQGPPAGMAPGPVPG